MHRDNEPPNIEIVWDQEWNLMRSTTKPVSKFLSLQDNTIRV